MKTFGAVIIILLVISAGLASCGDSQTSVVYAAGEGTVTYTDIEGGCWTIVADSGAEYNPGSLEAQYRVEGLRVRFEFIVLQGVAGVCMRGDYVSISSIEAI